MKENLIKLKGLLIEKNVKPKVIKRPHLGTFTVLKLSSRFLKFLLSNFEDLTFCLRFDTITSVAPSLSICGKDTKSYCTKSEKLPIVYVWKRQTNILYVGISVNGYSRPFGGHHHVIGVLDFIEPNDTFEIYITSEPRALEEYLIKVHHSKYNISHNGRGRASTAKYLRMKIEKSELERAERDRITKIRNNASRMISLIEAKKRVSAKLAELRIS